jgi:hypothetical protein
MEEQVSEEPTTKATCSNTEKEEQQAENVPENTEDTDAASGSKLEKSTDSTGIGNKYKILRQNKTFDVK